MPSLGPLEILVILFMALLVFGPERLPGMARNVGKALNELRRIQDSVKREINEFLHDDEAETARREPTRVAPTPAAPTRTSPPAVPPPASAPIATTGDAPASGPPAPGAGPSAPNAPRRAPSRFRAPPPIDR